MTSQQLHSPIVNLDTYLDGCTCGGEHPAPRTTLYTGADACRVMAQECKAVYGDQSVLLLSDPETHAVAGAELQHCLESENVNLSPRLLASVPVADDVTVDKIRAISKDMALIISVGSGTISDLGKYSASEDGIDFWSMPTASSMNGYTSGISAIKVKGVKRTLPATPPQRLYVLPAVIEEAPLKLRQSGFCDVMAKVVSDVDWRSESLLFSNSYCGLPSAMMAEVEQSYSEHPEEIGWGDKQAIEGLFHGLLISGAAMSLAGSSAPASGGEHLVSHFWDMREPLTGRVPELHGLQVGLGIILSSACYQHLAQLKSSELGQNAEPIFAATANLIPEIWGKYADEVGKQFDKKRELLLQFDTLLPQRWDELQDMFCQVRPPEYFVDLFKRVGAPFSLDAFGLSRDEFILAALNARAIRERITVLDFAAHAGVLEAAMEESLTLIG